MIQPSIVGLLVVASRPPYYSARQLPEVVDNLASLQPSKTASVSSVSTQFRVTMFPQ